MTALADYIATQNSIIAKERQIMADTPAKFQEDPPPVDPVPVFSTIRTMLRADSALSLSMGRDIATICGHDAGRIELFVAAVLGNAHAIARTVNNWRSDTGAMDHG